MKEILRGFHGGCMAGNKLLKRVIIKRDGVLIIERDKLRIVYRKNTNLAIVVGCCRFGKNGFYV